MKFRSQPHRRRALGAVAVLPVLFVVAAISGTLMNAGHAGAQPVRPDAELPLPAMQSPITFELTDERSYWFDTGLTALEPVLHTRSLGVAVAGSPTDVKFTIGEPDTSENHTVSSIGQVHGANVAPFRKARLMWAG